MEPHTFSVYADMRFNSSVHFVEMDFTFENCIYLTDTTGKLIVKRDDKEIAIFNSWVCVVKCEQKPGYTPAHVKEE